MGSTPLSFAHRDVFGRIQQAGKLPIGQSSAGPYLARITVRQDASIEVRELAFVVD